MILFTIIIQQNIRLVNVYHSLVFNLKDNAENYSGKSFDWDKSKGFAQNIKDKFFIAPDDKQLGLLNEYVSKYNDGQKAAKEWANSLSEDDKILKTYFTSLDGGIATQKGMTAALNKTTIASKAAAAGMKILSVAGNMLVGIGIGIALNLITEGISAIANAQQNAIDKSNELIGAWKEQRDTLESNKKSIDTISGDYEELAAGVDKFGNNVSLTAEEYKRYNEISKQISSMFPDLIKYHTDVSGAMTAEKTTVDELNKSYEKSAEIMNTDLIANSRDMFKGFVAKTNTNWAGKGTSKEILEVGKKLQGSLGNQEELKKTLLDLGGNYSTLFQQFAIKAKLKSVDVVDLMTPEAISQIDAAVSKIEQELQTAIQEIHPTIYAYLDDDASFSALSEDVQNNIKSLVAGLDISFYEGLNKDEIVPKIKEMFVAPVADAKNDIQSVLAEAYSINDQYVKGEISSEQFLAQVEPLREIIKKTFDPYEKYQLKFEFDDSLDTLNRLKESIESVAGKANTKLVFDGLNIDQLKELDKQLKDIVASKGDVNKYIANIMDWKSDSTLNTQLAENKNLLDKGKISYAEYNQYIVDYASKLGLASEELERFLGLFALSIPDTPDLSMAIDDYQAKISMASEALKKLKEDSLTANDVMDIMQTNADIDWSGVNFKDGNFGNLENILSDIQNAEAQKVSRYIDDALAKNAQLKQDLIKQIQLNESDSDIHLTKIAEINEQNEGLERQREFIETISKVDFSNESAKTVADDINDIADKYSQLSSLQQQIKDTGGLSPQSLKEIIATYPALISYVEQYITGLITEQDLIEKLADQYAIDEETYYQSVANKMGYSDTFYNNILSSNTDFVNEFSENYGVDLNNYKNLAEAKLAIEQQLIKNSASGWAQYYDAQKMAATGALEQIRYYDPTTYEAVKADIEKYEKAIKALNTISMNPIKVGFDRVKNSIDKTTDSAKDLESQLSGMKSSVDSLVSTVVAMLKQEYNDQKDGLQQDIENLDKKYELEKDHMDEIAEMQKKSYDDQKKAIEDNKNALKAELDARLEALRIKKEEYYWEKELNEANKNISELQSEYDIAKLDDSIEGQAKAKELAEKLAEEKENLEDKQFDNSIKKQEDALQKEYDNFEQQQNSKLELIERESERYDELHKQQLEQNEIRHTSEREALEAQIKDIEEKTKYEGTLRLEAMARIDKGGSELYDKLIAYNKLYGDGVDATIKTAWDNAYSALGQFNDGQINTLNTLNQLVTRMNDLTQQTQQAADAAQKLASTSSSGSGSATGNSSIRNALEMQLANAERQRQSISASQPGMVPQIDKLIADLKRQLASLPKFHEGGVVGGKYSNATEVFAKLLKGEVVVTPEQVERFYNDVLPSATSAMVNRQNQQMLEKFKNIVSPESLQGNTNGMVVNQGDININGNMDKSILQQVKTAMRGMSDELVNMVCNALVKDAGRRGVGKHATAL